MHLFFVLLPAHRVFVRCLANGLIGSIISNIHWLIAAARVLAANRLIALFALFGQC